MWAAALLLFALVRRMTPGSKTQVLTILTVTALLTGLGILCVCVVQGFPFSGGVFRNANMGAAVLVAFIPLLATARSRLLRFTGTPLLVLAIGLTGSRAGLAALAAGAQPSAIRQALENFSGLPHRLQYVATIKGVEYFNDSKATNVDAVIQALACFPGSVVLIMGGLDKGSDFTVLQKAVRQSVKELIVMGEAVSRIREALQSQVPTTAVATMAEALDKAHRTAAPGDAVLLSPGCASFDMYADYARRGDDFCRQVTRLQETANSKN